MLYVSRKKILKYPNLWRVVPRGFQNCGGSGLRDPPVSDAPGWMSRGKEGVTRTQVL